MKKTMFAIQNGFEFQNFKINDRRKFIHSLYATMKFERSHQLDRDDHFRFMVVRSPVKRLLSCYSNRVVHHKELSEKRLGPEALENGLSPDPSLSEFVENLSLYRKYSTSITHHSEPQTVFYGKNPEFFSRIYNIYELGRLSEDLSEKVGHTVTIGREQTGGPKLSPDDLSKSELQIIEDFYAEDLSIFGEYAEK